LGFEVGGTEVDSGIVTNIQPTEVIKRGEGRVLNKWRPRDKLNGIPVGDIDFLRNEFSG
jgi:hypothetical protein